VWSRDKQLCLSSATLEYQVINTVAENKVSSLKDILERAKEKV
jgi:hypothetical protein